MNEGLYQRTRRRCSSHAESNTDSQDAQQFQVKSGDVWDSDWSTVHRATLAQIGFDEFLSATPPDAVAVLYTPDRLTPDEFRHRVEDWRIRSGWLHPKQFCPRRRERKFEYVLSLEYGPFPRRGRFGRLHGHILLWNLRMIELPLLAAAWRELNGIKDEQEPVLARFAAPGGAISYALKTVGTNADMDRKSTRLNSSHLGISYAVFCLKKKITTLKSCTSAAFFFFFFYLFCIFFFLIHSSQYKKQKKSSFF